ncbi:hypothetical protein GCM10010339_87370 [Streptomyces alanosinicus]|uniref:Uncharacterized protein n=1 Tax=Streptomyces alanosinicus TaxID=68171 RepID=A0A918YS97_9ACTN|nr:hypothetical protein GCM10010339_87370 [Streptomyces alanosinicus]
MTDTNRIGHSIPLLLSERLPGAQLWARLCVPCAPNLDRAAVTRTLITEPACMVSAKTSQPTFRPPPWQALANTTDVQANHVAGAKPHVS